MTIKTRRIIAFLFCAAFFVAAPILLLQALGYRYDWQKNKWTKTGILTLKTIPEAVSISLNGESRKAQFASGLYRFSSLLPNAYEIRAEKEGYFPWKKTLEVQSEQVTFALDVVLFKQNAPISLQLFEGVLSLADQQGDRALFIERRETGDILQEFNLKNATLKTVFPLNTASEANIPIIILSASYSTSREKILLRTLKTQNYSKETYLAEYTIIDTRNTALQTPLNEKFENQFSDVRWSDIGDHLLYAWNKGKLYQINLLTNDQKILLDTAQKKTGTTFYESYTIANNNLYYFEAGDDMLALKQVALMGQKGMLPATLIVLPAKKDIIPAFISSAFNVPSFLDAQKETAYIYNPIKAKFSKLPAKQAHKRGDTWLYHNSFEIATWDEKTNETRLLNRFSGEIQECFWHPKYPYAFFSLNDALWVIELDTRDSVNQYKLVQTQNIQDVMINETGNRVFFNGIIDGKPGLYALDILD